MLVLLLSTTSVSALHPTLLEYQVFGPLLHLQQPCVLLVRCHGHVMVQQTTEVGDKLPDSKRRYQRC